MNAGVRAICNYPMSMLPRLHASRKGRVIGLSVSLHCLSSEGLVEGLAE